MNAPSPAVLRLRLTTEGYQVFQWCDFQGKILVRNKFHKEKSFWVVTGQMEITVERFGVFILEAGDRCVIPAETYHSVCFISEEDVIYLVGEK